MPIYGYGKSPTLHYTTFPLCLPEPFPLLLEICTNYTAVRINVCEKTLEVYFVHFIRPPYSEANTDDDSDLVDDVPRATTGSNPFLEETQKELRRAPSLRRQKDFQRRAAGSKKYAVFHQYAN